MERTVAVIEDITDRKWQAERAAHIQQALLPQEAPCLEGYEVAGACRAALDVAGDFYDWFVTEDGRLELTLADVMGKGVAAALIMAVLRTALRSAPQRLGPAARVRLAADSLAAGMKDEGLFVTLFQCRLDPATGVLCYVDAGHGHCAIRRSDGRFVKLPHRSLPVGVQEDGVFREGAAQLEPGDALILYSDGLVETEERTFQLEELTPSFDDSASAAEIVGRLMEPTPAKPADDVTLVVLRRVPEA
jgi:serine phosphatase RsbU (regulator of sigma subunit)